MANGVQRTTRARPRKQRKFSLRKKSDRVPSLFSTFSSFFLFHSPFWWQWSVKIQTPLRTSRAPRPLNRELAFHLILKRGYADLSVSSSSQKPFLGGKASRKYEDFSELCEVKTRGNSIELMDKTLSIEAVGLNRMDDLVLPLPVEENVEMEPSHLHLNVLCRNPKSQGN